MADDVIPDLASYDRVVVALSGGKDSEAAFLRLVELGVPRTKIEFFHYDVDGREGPGFVDWPCTPGYCRAFAKAFSIPISFGWKVGGFEGEMLRNNTPTAPTRFETPEGTIIERGGDGEPGVRLKFPQVAASLSARWCSAYLKVDVCEKMIVNQARFLHKRTLIVTGERAEESTARAKYDTFEVDRADNREGQRARRHVDRWLAVHGWTEAEVWAIIERHRVNPHPCYRLGFGRASCLHCIFGGPEQRAASRAIQPEVFARHAAYEQRFGRTVHRKLSVVQIADTTRFKVALAGQPATAKLIEGATPDEARARFYRKQRKALGLRGNEVLDVRPAAYTLDPHDVRAALDPIFDEPIILAPGTWVLPQGAFGDSTGPT